MLFIIWKKYIRMILIKQISMDVSSWNHLKIRHIETSCFILYCRPNDMLIAFWSVNNRAGMWIPQLMQCRDIANGDDKYGDIYLWNDILITMQNNHVIYISQSCNDMQRPSLFDKKHCILYHFLRTTHIYF